MDLSDMKNAKLVDVELAIEDDHYQTYLPGEEVAKAYYLRMTYRAENHEGEWEIVYPRVYLPFLTNYLPAVRHECTCERLLQLHSSWADFGFGELALRGNELGHTLEAKLIKPRIYDMTVSEIEKRLGCKIRIIGEDSK